MPIAVPMMMAKNGVLTMPTRRLFRLMSAWSLVPGTGWVLTSAGLITLWSPQPIQKPADFLRHVVLVREAGLFEVWLLLGAVKTEFGKFGDILDKTNKKLQEASNVMDDAARKSRTIERKLKGVQSLPEESAEKLLAEAAEKDDGVDIRPLV